MLVLEGYFDDSGTHDTADVATVAGLLSTPEQWSVFESEWSASLLEFGLSQGDAFHTTDCFSNGHPFEDWTDQDKRFRVAKLATIAAKHSLACIGAVIPVASFNRIFSKDAKRFVGGPYGLAASVCFMDAAKVLEPLYPSAKIAYIFEAGTTGAGEVLKVFQWNFKDSFQKERLKLLSLRFEGKEFVPLQAADLVSHQLCRYAPAQFGLKDFEPRVIQNLKIIRERQPLSWGRIDDEGLKMWAEVVEVAIKHHGSKRKKSRRRKK